MGSAAVSFVTVQQCCRGAKEACSLSMWYADQADAKEVSEFMRLREGHFRTGTYYLNFLSCFIMP